MGRETSLTASIECRLGSKTVLTAPKCHFRVTPRNGRHQVGPLGRVRANSSLDKHTGF
jgi:hypothetical protein